MVHADGIVSSACGWSVLGHDIWMHTTVHSSRSSTSLLHLPLDLPPSLYCSHLMFAPLCPAQPALHDTTPFHTHPCSFNVYTTQPVIKSGCVLRRSNVGVLEREQLVSQHDVDLCKSRMNTFAYMGDLKNSPEVACVYHSEEAENQYLDQLRQGGGGSPLSSAVKQAAAAGGASSTGGK